MRTIALLTFATLFAAGAASAQDAAKAAAPARAKAPAHATVSILEPKNGAHVGQDVLVKFGAKNISVAGATDMFLAPNLTSTSWPTCAPFFGSRIDTVACARAKAPAAKRVARVNKAMVR